MGDEAGARFLNGSSGGTAGKVFGGARPDERRDKVGQVKASTEKRTLAPASLISQGCDRGK